jgi:septal ring factor EnvC (AmiA/AmiB activator)
MVVIGLLLVLIALALGVAVVIESTQPAQVEVFDYQIENATVAEVFLGGALTAAVLLIGLALMSRGLRRAGSRRREIRAQRREQQDALREQEAQSHALAQERNRLAEEKADLEARLAQQRPPSHPADTTADDRTQEMASRDNTIDRLLHRDDEGRPTTADGRPIAPPDDRRDVPQR